MTRANGMIERFLRAVEEQSRATATMSELQRQNNDVLELMRTETRNQTTVLQQLAQAFQTADAKADAQRDAAVAEVKQHISTTFEDRDQWWRKMIVILGICLIISNLLGVAGAKLLEWIGK